MDMSECANPGLISDTLIRPMVGMKALLLSLYLIKFGVNILFDYILKFYELTTCIYNRENDLCISVDKISMEVMGLGYNY